MTYSIEATHIFTEDDGFMVMVGFANDNFDPSKYILLQKAHIYDEQDVKLGMDKLHVQIDDESRSVYGGVEAITVKGREIDISLSNSARASLKVDGDIVINISADDFEFDNVVSQLKRVSEADKIKFIC